MYFFTKGSSKEIIQAYHNLIGKPALTPFWSMGWHAASYDYKDLASYEKVIADYKSHGIPLEGVFFDIPYLSDGADFSVNSKTFPNLQTWSQNLKKNNQKLTVIIDGGISADDFENQYFSHASNQKVLLKSSVNPGWLTQHVWSKKSVFLDFMNEQAALIWMTGINNLFDEVEYDGLWLDMNEATGFCDGECVDGTVP
jgi:alpha-glucosidase (family GH31 glycosyl hydrolase)